MLSVEYMLFNSSLCKKLGIAFKNEVYHGKLTDVALLVGSDYILDNVKIFIRDSDDDTVEGVTYREIKDAVESTDLKIEGISLGLAVNRDAFNQSGTGVNNDEVYLSGVFNTLLNTGSSKVVEIISVKHNHFTYYDFIIDKLVNDLSIKRDSRYRISGTL